MSEALVGTAADAEVASANTGQTITLQGRGFTTSTLVQFTARDDGGTDGVLTRTGTPSADGNELTIAVPALARTGAVRVLGEADTFGLQVVPTLRALGGALAVGETALLDGTGLVSGDVRVSVGGQEVRGTTMTISDYGEHQQVHAFTVPAGVGGASSLRVTTAGGSAELLLGTTGLVGSTSVTGTPRYANVAAANVGQTLRLNGAGLLNTDRVEFLTSDSNGFFRLSSFAPLFVASDGSYLDVTVPTNAISGPVRVVGSAGGSFLQVVPTLVDIDQGLNDQLLRWRSSVAGNRVLWKVRARFILMVRALLIEVRLQSNSTSVGSLRTRVMAWTCWFPRALRQVRSV